MILRSLPLVVLAVTLAASGCGGTDAYVFQKKEFDRNRPDFGKPPTDRSELTICYNGAGTSDGRVARMADEECGRFGKRAEAAGESFGECPLLVPVAAHFTCLPRTAAPDETLAPADDAAAALPEAGSAATPGE